MIHGLEFGHLSLGGRLSTTEGTTLPRTHRQPLIGRSGPRGPGVARSVGAQKRKGPSGVARCGCGGGGGDGGEGLMEAERLRI